MKKYHVKCDAPMEIASHQGEYTVVTVSQKQQPGGFEHFGDNVKFIGYSKAGSSIPDKERNIIFVSLGTLCKSKSFWNKCLLATKDLGYNVVFVLGGNSMDNIDQKLINEHVTIHTSVSLAEYEDYIQRSVLFINHGGMNSITMSLYYKTPVLVCPNSTEQHENGKAVKRNNCGNTYKNQKITVKQLKNQIESIIHSDSIANSLIECSNDLNNSIGFEKIAKDIITSFNLSEL